jgi:hypothetical protein
MARTESACSSTTLALDFSDGGMQIKFCPWCGADLNQQYGTPVTLSEESKAEKS